MKYIIAILLMVTIAIQTFSKWVVICVYEINKDYIAANLCVNRSKPARCCRGKCFLNKRLTSDEDQQQAAGKSSWQDTQVDFFLQRAVGVDFELPSLREQHNLFYINDKAQEFSSSFFQPPQCCLRTIV